MTYQWRSQTFTRPYDFPSARVSPLTIEVRPNAVRPDTVASRIGFLEGLAKSFPATASIPLTSKHRDPRPLFSPGVSTRYAKPAHLRKARDGESPRVSVEAGRTAQGDGVASNSDGSLLARATKDRDGERDYIDAEEKEQSMRSPSPEAMNVPAEVPDSYIRQRDASRTTVESELSNVTTSTDRRRAIRELFDEYGVERPSGLASSEVDTPHENAAEHVIRYKYCHNCSWLNRLLDSRCWRCGHRLCIECDILSISPVSEKSTQEHIEDVALRSKRHSAARKSTSNTISNWSGKGKHTAGREESGLSLSTPTLLHESVPRRCSHNEAAGRVFRPGQQNLRTNSIKDNPFVVVDRRVSAPAHILNQHNGHIREQHRIARIDESGQTEHRRGRPSPRPNSHFSSSLQSPSHMARHHQSSTPRQPFPTPAIRGSPCLEKLPRSLHHVSRLKSQPVLRAHSPGLLQEQRSHISVPVSAPAIERVSGQTFGRPASASPAQVIISTSSHLYTTEYTPLPPATYEKSGPEYFELKRRSHAAEGSAVSNESVRRSPYMTPAVPVRESTRAKALSQLKEKSAPSSRLQEARGNDRASQGPDEGSARMKALSRLQSLGAIQALPDTPQDREKVKRINNERIALFGKPKRHDSELAMKPEKSKQVMAKAGEKYNLQDTRAKEVENATRKVIQMKEEELEKIEQEIEYFEAEIVSESNDLQEPVGEEIELKTLPHTPSQPEHSEYIEDKHEELHQSEQSSRHSAEQMSEATTPDSQDFESTYELSSEPHSRSPSASPKPYSETLQKNGLASHVPTPKPPPEATHIKSPEVPSTTHSQEQHILHGTPSNDWDTNLIYERVQDVMKEETEGQGQSAEVDLKILGITVMMHFEKREDLVLKIDLSGESQEGVGWSSVNEGETLD